MALFEALGELVAAALLSAATGRDPAGPSDALPPKQLGHWLQGRPEAASLNVVIDALAREIWVGPETRSLSQQALEHHVQSVAGLLTTHRPEAAHLTQATERARTGAAGRAGAVDPVARRIAVDIFARARAAGGVGGAGLRDEVTLFLLDRVFAHLLDDPTVLDGFAPALEAFLAEQRPVAVPAADVAAPAATASDAPTATSGLIALGLREATTHALAAAGGVGYLASLRERFGLSETAMRRALALIETQGTADDDIVGKLEELAAWIGDVRAQLQRPSNDEAEVRKQKARAAQALADGEFEAAAEALRQVRRELREGRRRTEERLQEEVQGLRAQMIEEARATGRLAELALARGDFLAAADLAAEAATSLPTSDRAGIWQLQLLRAEALLRQGIATGETGVLTEAHAAYSQTVRLAADGSSPKGLALASIGLANTLVQLAGRESGTARFKDAAAAYRKALQVLSRADEPRLWAGTQLRLGRALATAAEREGATDLMREAAQAYREAAGEIQAASAPGDHAAAQLGLGGMLLALEEHGGGVELLREAAGAYRAGLDTIDRATAPQVWADAQHNLGLALLGAGEQTSGAESLEAALAAFDAALEVLVREEAPQKWALAQMNRGNALAALGETGGADPAARFEAAIAAYTQSLDAFRRDDEPLKWAITQMNLGTALIRLGEHRDKRRHWLAAAGALVPALEVFERQGADAYADVTRRSLKRFHESWESLIAAPGGQSAPPKPKLSQAV